MANLEETLAQGVKDGKIPHAVVYATNKDGSFTYKHAVGKMLYPGDTPIKEDAVFLLASQSKFLTSIAALQIVEKGLFGLDDDVSDKLPELGQQQILKGFDDNDKPIFEQKKNHVTLRQLLTHSAGIAYDMGDPNLTKYSKQRGHEPNSGITVLGRFTYPLIYEPGTSWTYSPGMDWTGLLVERVTGMTLEEYEKKNMWEPLGIRDITFWPYSNDATKGRVPQLTVRGPDGQLVPFDAPFINTGSEGCFGGHGTYATMADFLKVEQSILANDGKLLKPETVDMMFTPQLGPESEKALNDTLGTPMGAMFIGEFKPDVPVQWGLGGLLFMKDDHGRRRKGSMTWGGMANCYWLLDREAGLAITLGTQVLPPGDKGVKETISAVEYAMYEKAGVKF